MKITGFLFALMPLFVLPDQARGQCYELVWADEFTRDGLPDSARWSYDAGGDGWGNNELQYYTSNRSQNARVEDGKLIIEAHKETFLNCEYTSARLVSKLKGDWLYGSVEVRAKLPGGRGTWAAIWMLPTDWEYGSWPNSGEIDIMEYVGYDAGKIYGTIHTEAYNHTLGTQKGSSATLSDETEAFHVYKATWTPENIEIYVDDTKYYTFNNSHTGYTTWPFDKRFHLLLNLAVGGNWGGSQGVDPSVFPARMEIDYVRVYQAPEKLTILGPDKAYPMQEEVHFFLYHDQEAGYSWSVKGDGIITSPDDSNEVYVRWGCNADTVMCHLITACGTYDLAFPVALETYALEAPYFVEPFQDHVLFKAPDLYGTTYAWSVPSGVTITTGQQDDSLHTAWGEFPGIVTLEVNNTCGIHEVSRMIRFYGQYAYPDPDAPALIPGILNPTRYDYGGEGIAYHDAEASNQGSGPREEEGVDTEFNDKGIANVGWISDGEWLEFTIRVTGEEYYQAGIRVASNVASRGPLRILFNGEERIPDIELPFTGSWSTFTTHIVYDLPFYSTDTIIRLYAVKGGFNLGNIIIDTDVSNAVKETRTKTITVYPNPVSDVVFIASDRPVMKTVLRDISGKTLQVIEQNEPYGGSRRTLAINLRDNQPGLYFLHITTADYKEEVVKIVCW